MTGGRLKCEKNRIINRHCLYDNVQEKDLNAYIYSMCYSDGKYDATIYARDYAVHRLLVNLNNSHTNPLLQFVPDHPWEKEKITLIKKKCHEYDAEWRESLAHLIFIIYDEI